VKNETTKQNRACVDTTACSHTAQRLRYMNIDELKREVLKVPLRNWETKVKVELRDRKGSWLVTPTHARYDVDQNEFVLTVEEG
jgi:hypothetical protein